MRRKRLRAKSQTATPAPAPAPIPAPAPASAPAVAAAPAVPVPDRIDALTEAIGGELGRLRGEIRARDTDLVQALHRLAASYDRVADRLDHDRRVQALLAEGLVRIDRRLSAIDGRRSPRDELPHTQRVIGGSIAPRQDIPRLDH
jgi:hypothetical protein